MMSIEFENGIFIEECKSRFRCKVVINGFEELCYLSSSSKLAKLIQLPGREVLLKRNASKKSKTKYTVHAVKTPNGYVLLNLGFVNSLLKAEFNKPESIYSGDKIYCEKKVTGGLKSDFYIEGIRKTIIEAKGIISEEPIANFPSMTVERAINQLQAFSKLLKTGYNVHYYIVLMSPYINYLQPDKTQIEFYRNFEDCLKNGMKLFVYKTVWNNKYSASVLRDNLIENLFLCKTINMVTG